MPGLGLICSPTHEIRVGYPRERWQDVLAQDLYSRDPGLVLALGGSRSPRLDRGRAVLLDFVARTPDSLGGARVATILSDGLARPFFEIDREHKRLRQVHARDLEASLELSSKALTTVGQAEGFELAHNALVRQRAPLLDELGQREQARAELVSLRDKLEGVEQQISLRAEVDAMLENLDEG